MSTTRDYLGEKITIDDRSCKKCNAIMDVILSRETTGKKSRIIATYRCQNNECDQVWLKCEYDEVRSNK